MLVWIFCWCVIHNQVVVLLIVFEGCRLYRKKASKRRGCFASSFNLLFILPPPKFYVQNHDPINMNWLIDILMRWDTITCLYVVMLPYALISMKIVIIVVYVVDEGYEVMWYLQFHMHSFALHLIWSNMSPFAGRDLYRYAPYVTRGGVRCSFTPCWV
jgi:hypothetical protein